MVSTHNQIISEETLSNLKDLRKDCKGMKEAFLIESTQQSDPLVKTLYKSIAASFVNAELISSWVELSLVSINKLGKTIDKLPNNQRCYTPRKEHGNQKKRTGAGLKIIQKNKK
ncbi:MAG: hypothetical protein WCC52_03625 [Nitrosotalea sp.]